MQFIAYLVNINKNKHIMVFDINLMLRTHDIRNYFNKLISVQNIVLAYCRPDTKLIWMSWIQQASKFDPEKNCTLTPSCLS